MTAQSYGGKQGRAEEMGKMRQVAEERERATANQEEGEAEEAR